MRGKKLLLVALVALLVLGLTLPAAAAKKKKKKGKQGKQADKIENHDPWANRWGLSLGGGGVSSSAGFGFEGRVGVTYYVNRFVHVTLAPGFGTYPISYDNPVNNDTETAYIKYAPVDLSLIITPVRSWRFNPYFGPGVGMTYFWWTQKEQDPKSPKDTVEEDYDETLYSGFVTAGISSSLGGPFVMNVGVTYTIPDLQNFTTEDATISFGFGGGVVF